MPYTPPTGNAADFDFTVGGYTPPTGNTTNFDFGALPPAPAPFVQSEVSAPPRRARFHHQTDEAAQYSPLFTAEGIIELPLSAGRESDQKRLAKPHATYAHENFRHESPTLLLPVNDHADVSKELGYAVLAPPDAAASTKYQAYALLDPPNAAASPKYLGYVILQPNPFQPQPGGEQRYLKRVSHPKLNDEEVYNFNPNLFISIPRGRTIVCIMQ